MSVTSRRECPHVRINRNHSARSAPVRNRSIEARRAARLAKARRESRIVDLLNRGVSVAEIAARENVTEKRMRALISEILARRMPEPPAEFVALQVSRLNEALLVAYGAMSGANLRAVDRVVKIVRELDRYHGFSASRRRVPDAPRLEQEDRLALDARPTNRPETAPQAVEKAESAPGNGAALAASQDATAMRDEVSASFLETPAQEFALDAPPTDRPETAPQELEKAKSAAGNGSGFGSLRPAGRGSREQSSVGARRRAGARVRGRAAGQSPGNGAASSLKSLNSRPEMARLGRARSAAHPSSARPPARAPSDGRMSGRRSTGSRPVNAFSR